MPAPTFPNNAHRFDPYRTFKFRVAVGGVVVAALSKMGKLSRKVEVAKWRSADGPNNQMFMPGGTTFEPFTLERGVTHDPLFEEWANATFNLISGDAGHLPVSYRRAVVIEVLNLKGQPAITYKLKNAWVSDYTALPEMDANNMNTVAIQHLTIQHDGFSRDVAIEEPAETD